MRKYTFAPHPFVLTPPLDPRSHIRAGERLHLEFVLVGRAISRLAYFIQVIEELGRRGVGPCKSRFTVELVQSLSKGNGNRRGESHLVYEGVSRRIVASPVVIEGNEFEEGARDGGKVRISLITPTRIISDGKLANDLPFVTIVRALLRRIALLSYFHCGQDADADLIRRLIASATPIETTKSSLEWKDWSRFSTRQRAAMKLGGLVGQLTFEGDLERFLPYLRAGEVVHIGKGTSFGLGKYILTDPRVAATTCHAN